MKKCFLAHNLIFSFLFNDENFTEKLDLRGYCDVCFEG